MSGCADALSSTSRVVSCQPRRAAKACSGELGFLHPSSQERTSIVVHRPSSPRSDRPVDRSRRRHMAADPGTPAGSPAGIAASLGH
ncbi:hypothetical protein PsYK624_134530 [Phanerochaete sordida]|uniref:Uncharacterized protein n=1 Tax=Phanerochaete sordida TaxID=48140 RepID=A0A9P3GLP2_9APHY|nr:hypothetical protein PsYK624_134530 [Phanerochaete sordida]